MQSFFRKRTMEATGSNGQNEASENRNDKEGNLDGCNVFFGLIGPGNVLLFGVPLGLVELVGIDNDFSVLVVLAGLDVVNKVAHLLFVGLLLSRLYGSKEIEKVRYCRGTTTTSTRHEEELT